MTPAFIAGVERQLDAWRPSRLRLQGVKPAVELAALPTVHTIGGVPTDYDQGSIGSCTANALAELYEHDLGGKWSRLFSYFFTRATEGDFIDDTGVTIPDLMAVGHTMGLPPETSWPYDVAKMATPPPVETLVEAVKHRVHAWDVVVDLDHLLFELANNYPVLLGFQVPASMQGGHTVLDGLVDMPSSENQSIGGHCVLAFGYDRTPDQEWVRCTCHWGPNYGDGGTIKLPFAYFTTGLANDLSVVRSVS